MYAWSVPACPARIDASAGAPHVRMECSRFEATVAKVSEGTQFRVALATGGGSGRTVRLRAWNPRGEAYTDVLSGLLCDASVGGLVPPDVDWYDSSGGVTS